MSIYNVPEFTVTELNQLIKNTIENNFTYVKVRGEISEVKTASKGQIYITFKDKNSILSGVIWSSKIHTLKIKPEIGIEVFATGKITTWSRYKTTYQIDIDNFEIAGEGALLKLIEMRKKKLESKGIFDQKYKKKIPYLPKKIGIITSPTGSVIHDIINRLKERFPVDVDLWPAPVQGNEATEIIIKAIKCFNDDFYENKPETIIIARGGGSVEDLMTFNDEKLAIAVFNSKIPIISAIGHETDTTIIDLVSDLRVPTPTAAAEKVVPVRIELVHYINNLFIRFNNLIKFKHTSSYNLLNNTIKLLKKPENLFKNYNEKFFILNKELNNSYKSLIEKKKYIFQNQKSKLKSPLELFNLKKIQSFNLFKNLEISIFSKIKESTFQLKSNIRILKSNSVSENLNKGYVLLKRNNKLIKRSKELKDQESIKIKFFDKQITAKIKKIN